MGKNFISAEEAKRISETTDKLISMVFKHIKFEAEAGYSEFHLGVERTSANTVKRLHIELKNAGFSVLFAYENAMDELTDILFEDKLPEYIVVKW